MAPEVVEMLDLTLSEKTDGYICGSSGSGAEIGWSVLVYIHAPQAYTSSPPTS